MNISDFINEEQKKEKIDEFNTLKTFKGKFYSGMRVGREHKWKYNNGIWSEKKLSPDKWKIAFSCVKERFLPAPRRLPYS